MAEEVKKLKKACYFGTDQKFVFKLPDGEQHIVHKKLNEGERKKYQDLSSSEMTMVQGSPKMNMSFQLGSDRHTLLKLAICGWLLYDEEGNEVVFDGDATGGKRHLEKFLSECDPDIIDALEKDIRDKNPWLTADDTVENIDKQIVELEKRKKTVKGREAKN